MIDFIVFCIAVLAATFALLFTVTGVHSVYSNTVHDYYICKKYSPINSKCLKYNFMHDKKEYRLTLVKEK